MNYEQGLSRLRTYLSKNVADMAIEQLDVLERQLSDSLEQVANHPTDDVALATLDKTLAGLDRLSWRTLAVAFADLCDPTAHLRPRFAISIKGMIVLVLTILLLPAVSIAAATSVNEQYQLFQVDQDREDIQRIDGRINREVTSPYYLSSVPEDPCSTSTLNQITQNNIIIHVSDPGIESVVCVWEYHDRDSGQIIAEDYWGGVFHSLIKREYYRDNTMIAEDVFNFDRYDCVKERLYAIGKGISECYSETGELLSINPQELWFSPIPPMTYWFFYR